MFHQDPIPTIEYGSIGWEDEDEYIFPGDESNDGHTLVRVQLFRGRSDFSRPLSATRAQGIRLVAHVNSLGGFRVPPKDSRCMVAVPAGMEQTPGAALIIGVIEKASARQDNLPNGSTVQSAGQGQARVIERNDGRVAIFTTSNNAEDGKSVYFEVAPDGFKFVAPWGTLRFDATGFHLLHSSGASLDLGAIGGLPFPMSAISSYVKMQAGAIIGTGATVTLGTGTPALLAKASHVDTAVTKLQAQVDAIAGALDKLKDAFDTSIAAPPGPNPPDGRYLALLTALGVPGNNALSKISTAVSVNSTESPLVEDAIDEFPSTTSSY